MVFERRVVERCIVARRIQRYEELIADLKQRLSSEEALGHNCSPRQMSIFREEIISTQHRLEHATAELVQAPVTALCG